MGRPSKYETNVKPFFDEIKSAVERGVEENKIAKNLGVSVASWCEYKLKYPEFAELFKIDEAKRREIIDKLDGALMKAALGYFETDEKTYIDQIDGKEKKHIERTKKYYPPNVTAIFGAYNRFDPNYVKDRAYYELRVKELELKQMSIEMDNW